MEREDGRFGLGIALLFVAAIYAVTPISPPHLMDDVDGVQAQISRTMLSSRLRELADAGVVVREGRVYLLDYDKDKKQTALRCLSLADGGEIWRFAYPMPVKRNHGVTRTVPAISGQFIVAIDPKCHVLCLDAATGELRWGMNLVSEYGATVPQWYAGQCPLIDGNALILAPGGPDVPCRASLPD